MTPTTNEIEHKIVELLPGARVRIRSVLVNPDSEVWVRGKEAVISGTAFQLEGGYSYNAVCEGQEISLWWADVESVIV